MNQIISFFDNYPFVPYAIVVTELAVLAVLWHFVRKWNEGYKKWADNQAQAEISRKEDKLDQALSNERREKKS